MDPIIDPKSLDALYADPDNPEHLHALAHQVARALAVEFYGTDDGPLLSEDDHHRLAEMRDIFRKHELYQWLGKYAGLAGVVGAVHMTAENLKTWTGNDEFLNLVECVWKADALPSNVTALLEDDLDLLREERIRYDLGTAEIEQVVSRCRAVLDLAEAVEAYAGAEAGRTGRKRGVLARAAELVAGGAGSPKRRAKLKADLDVYREVFDHELPEALADVEYLLTGKVSVDILFDDRIIEGLLGRKGDSVAAKEELVAHAFAQVYPGRKDFDPAIRERVSYIARAMTPEGIKLWLGQYRGLPGFIAHVMETVDSLSNVPENSWVLRNLVGVEMPVPLRMYAKGATLSEKLEWLGTFMSTYSNRREFGTAGWLAEQSLLLLEAACDGPDGSEPDRAAMRDRLSRTREYLVADAQQAGITFAVEDTGSEGSSEE